ncbi:MAG: hypothetical protein GYB58_20225 [Gammaproteobacteria bacterium]|nr:hypothetical protein [Gammaproteobacteria bacterium]
MEPLNKLKSHVAGLNQFDFDFSATAFPPLKEPIISYDESGKILSRYSDNTWRIESGIDTLILNFSLPTENLKYPNEEIIELLKGLQIYALYCPLKRADFKTGYSKQKIINYALRRLAEIAIKEKVSFHKLLTGNFNHILEPALTPSVCRGLLHLIDVLEYYKANRIKITPSLISVKRRFRKYIEYMLDELTKTTQQTLPIPERIYLNSLLKLESDLSLITDFDIDKLIYIINMNASHPIFGSSQIEARRHLKINGKYLNILKKTKRTNLPNNYNYGWPLKDSDEFNQYFKKLESFNKNRSIEGILQYFGEVQEVCFRVLIAYTGARISDISILRQNSLKLHTIATNTYPLIYGESKKSSLTDTGVGFWVTNDIGKHAYDLAQKISQVIYNTAKNEKYIKTVSNERLLFPAIKNSRKAHSKHTHKQFTQSFKKLSVSDSSILETDKVEIMRIDPNLDFEREDLNVGVQWSYKSHQFRRSLAIYAVASGTVSIPSLRRQLRQLHNAMALFYSSGSNAANNIVSQLNNFTSVYRDSLAPATAIALHKFVISDQTIFGPMGRHLAKNNDLKNIILNQDTTETTKMVERGELAFSETALGGCGETGNCDYRPFALIDISHCKGCDKSYQSLSKIERTIELYNRTLVNMEKNSRQYKWRASQIQDLIEIRDSHVINVQNGICND